MKLARDGQRVEVFGQLAGRAVAVRGTEHAYRDYVVTKQVASPSYGYLVAQ